MDPFAEMYQLMKRPDPSDGLQLAEGVVISTDPLAIEAFGVLWKNGDCAVNAALLNGAARPVRFEANPVTIHGTITTPIGGGEGTLAANATTYTGTMTATGIGLKEKDRVLCLTDGGQSIYVLMKVVH